MPTPFTRPCFSRTRPVADASSPARAHVPIRGRVRKGGRSPRAWSLRLAQSLALGVPLLVGCAGAPTETVGPPRAETVVAVTDGAELIRFNAGQPQRVLQRMPLKGLPAGDRLVGIDYRVARGLLYALSASGYLYTVNTDTAQLSRVGNGAPVALTGQRFAFDFNPAADRIRVVSDSGQNLRLHPDTGAVAATDPAVQAPGAAVRLGGAAYTYNKKDEKLTTNFAIDLASGTLMLQGSREGAVPAVSPNTGLLSAVGAMGTGPLEDAAFDIADLNNAAFVAVRVAGRTRLHTLDLANGRATPIGTVADGRALWGMAIVP